MRWCGRSRAWQRIHQPRRRLRRCRREVRKKPPRRELRNLLLKPCPTARNRWAGCGSRSLAQLLYRLSAERYQGIVEIKSFPGRFCLVGKATDGYSLAPEELPFAKCDAVGNPREGAPRVSLPFANLVGEIRHATHGALDVQLTPGEASATVLPYPQVSPELTAGQWNRAGSANNRIEIHLP